MPIPPADILTAYDGSDWLGKGIVLIQLVISIYAWSMLISRSLDLARVKKATAEFRHFFGRTRSIVEYYFTRGSGKSPILNIYFQATEKLVAELGSSAGAKPKSLQETRGRLLSEASFELVKGVAEESLAEQTNRLEDGMNIIGAITTLTPLLGLFGTVSGVLSAFQDMGQQGSVNLATVAPSLSTAMVTTVVGIGVAIPTIIGYNVLVGSIEKLRIQFDGFADEYLGRLRREFCEGRANDGD